YILSMYAKLGASADRFTRSLTISPDVTFFTVNLGSGATIDNSGAPAANFTAANVGSGWYRISYTYVPSSTTTISFVPRMYSQAAGGTSYTGNGTSSVLWFGPQLEVSTGNTTPCTYAPT